MKSECILLLFIRNQMCEMQQETVEYKVFFFYFVDLFCGGIKGQLSLCVQHEANIISVWLSYIKLKNAKIVYNEIILCYSSGEGNPVHFAVQWRRCCGRAGNNWVCCLQSATFIYILKVIICWFWLYTIVESSFLTNQTHKLKTCNCW